ncbi:MAG TPA: methyltransferase domain-containing protein [Firmicutes bacterium]|nr:methyltransferase domain-containing protein [Bacillota bacterium]
MFEKYFNQAMKWIEFPHFVPQEELDYNQEYAKRITEEKWIFYRWREDIERGGWIQYSDTAERIVAHGGLILEICAGPGGGFAPAILMKNYHANLMMSDLCPTVVREWCHHFKNMDNPPPNVEYAALDVCHLPFIDNCLDVVSGRGAIINIEGDRNQALKEIYRVLKPGGLFAFDYIYVSEESYNQMPVQAREIIKERYPTAFWDTLDIFDQLGFSNTETIEKGQWSNKDDESTLADLCRSLDTYLTFSHFVKYCIK